MQAELVCQGKIKLPLSVLPTRVLGREPIARREQRIREARLDANLVAMRTAMERAYRRNTQAESEDEEESVAWWRESIGWR
jgi:hypothetical protein